MLQTHLVLLLATLLVLSPWLAPLPGAEVLRGYQPPAQSWRAGHRGIDFYASSGTPVHAIGAGVVVFAGQIAGKPVISVQHPDLGLRSTYEPVVASVKRGDSVLAGELIGSVAVMGGHCAGRCLHLGLKDPVAGTYRNPLELLRPGIAVLKALAG